MKTGRSQQAAHVALAAFALVAAASVFTACVAPESSESAGESLSAAHPTTHITLTSGREACTPFGDLPRPLDTKLNGLFNPLCVGGGKKLDDFVDGEGTPRVACLYTPEAAATSVKLPLVIFLHPSVIGPDITAALADIRQQLDTADLTGDATRPGFYLLEPAGRVINDRYYPFPDNADSPGWDNWNRQMWPGGARTVNDVVYPENVDAATIDAYLAEAIATGNVDESRVYVMGCRTARRWESFTPSIDRTSRRRRCTPRRTRFIASTIRARKLR